MPPILPVSHVLVVSGDAAYRQQVVAGLNAAAGRLDQPFGLQAHGVADGEAALAAVRADGELQLVLIDHGDQVDRSDSADHSPIGIAQQIMRLRPELSLYMMLEDDDTKLLVEQLASDAIDGYFYRSETDHAGWLHILAAELAEKSATPFYDQLKRYVALAKDSWHTPGHAGGDSYKGSPWVADFHDFVGEQMLRADLSVSVPMLDSLLHPTGVILQAQRLAAKAFGARQTYFATNGTSTSNKVIFQTLLAPGDQLLLDRNCHKSVHHGVILSGARPVYLDSSLHARLGLFGPVPKATLYQAIEQHPDAKVLILTSCTYDGLRYDLAPIIAAAHAQGLKVVVDEAWSAHARFHPELRPTALECGADYVTQSTHKVLSAFSQASMIHVNDLDFDAHLFRENFNMHASTSPQYGLIASLDVARKQAVMEGYKLLDRSLKFAAELRDRINATGVFRVLTLDELLPDEVRGDGIRLDPTKLTLDLSASGYSADELRSELIERHNIQVEKHTHATLTLLLTIGTTRSKVSRLFDAMLRLARQSKLQQRLPQPALRMPQVPHFSRLACLPRDAFYETGERLALLDDAGQPNAALHGRICCDQIVPYPPGIPVLVPGQVIEPAVLTYLARLLQTQKSIELHGLASEHGEVQLRVLTEPEAAHLPAFK
ncbi:MAG: aminotransferase class I/II-fold pyridoxal phosphate-dependent enzyme [Leptothrix sp. (in: b-proteobacteria)]